MAPSPAGFRSLRPRTSLRLPQRPPTASENASSILPLARASCVGMPGLNNAHEGVSNVPCDLVFEAVLQQAKVGVDPVVAARALGQPQDRVEENDPPYPVELDGRGRACALEGAHDRIAVASTADLVEQQVACVLRDLDGPAPHGEPD